MMGVWGGRGLSVSKALKTQENLQENIGLGVVVDVKTLKFNEAFNATSIDLCQGCKLTDGELGKNLHLS